MKNGRIQVEAPPISAEEAGRILGLTSARMGALIRSADRELAGGSRKVRRYKAAKRAGRVAFRTKKTGRSLAKSIAKKA